MNEEWWEFQTKFRTANQRVIKIGMNIQEYLEQENEKPVENEPFEPSESRWNWLKKSLTAIQCWIGTHIWQTKEIIGVFEGIGSTTNEKPEIP